MLHVAGLGQHVGMVLLQPALLLLRMHVAHCRHMQIILKVKHPKQQDGSSGSICHVMPGIINAHIVWTAAGAGRATFMSFKSLPVRAVRAYRSTVRVSAIAAPLADQQASAGGDTPPPRSRPPSPMGGGGDYGDQGRKPSYVRYKAYVCMSGRVFATKL